jgi:hypothetical protein
MATERQSWSGETVDNRPEPQSWSLQPPPTAGNTLSEITVLQIEPRLPKLTPFIATQVAEKISTEPTEPTAHPIINTADDISNPHATLNYYKFAKSKIVRHTSFTQLEASQPQASARGRAHHSIGGYP